MPDDEHKFQLVFQFPASTHDEWESLMSLLDEVTNDLACNDEPLVDGYDFGLGEYNIFIHTNLPQTTFLQAKESIERHRSDLIFRAGYRDFDEDDYVPMWPPDLKTFKVL